MMKVRQKILAAGLSAILLYGCSPPGPIPPKIATEPGASRASDETGHEQRGRWGDETDTGEPVLGGAGKKRQASRADAKIGDAKGGRDKNAPSESLAYQTAVNGCNAEATKQTMGNILTIVTRLRPGAYTASYVACMRKKGYDVSQ